MLHHPAHLGYALIVCLMIFIAFPCTARAQTRAANHFLGVLSPYSGRLTLGDRLATHGFISQGFLWSSGNNYLAQSKKGSFEFTEVGLSIAADLGGGFTAGIQFFSRDLGPTGGYTPQVDWAYLGYKWRDWLGIRLGRVKIPFGLYNEMSDIDAARVPILLPQSIYQIENRQFLLAQTGAEISGIIPLARAGELEYSAYAGTLYTDISSTPNINSLHVPYLAGGRLLWRTPLKGFTFGSSALAGELESNATLSQKQIDTFAASGVLFPSGFDGKIENTVSAVFVAASAEYVRGGLLVAAEYSRRYIENTSSVPATIPKAKTTNEKAYLMASYEFLEWFTGGIYYSIDFKDIDLRSHFDKTQHDLAATLRFNVGAHFVLKIEGHYLNGTAVLSPALNDNRPNSESKKNWALLLTKATVTF